MIFACAVYIILSTCKRGKERNITLEKNDKKEKVEIREIITEKKETDERDEKSSELESEKSKSKILLGCVFSLNLWLIMLVGGITTFVLKSMSDWTGLFLVEYSGLNISTTTELMLWNEIGGMAGTLACGVLSDLLGGRKYLTVLIFVFICIPSIAYFPTTFHGINSIENYENSSEGFFGNFEWVFTVDSVLQNSRFFGSFLFNRFSGDLGLARLCLFSMGFGINGPKTLLGVMIRDLVPRGVSGTIGGVFGLVAQIGASASGAGEIM